MRWCNAYHDTLHVRTTFTYHTTSLSYLTNSRACSHIHTWYVCLLNMKTGRRYDAHSPLINVLSIHMYYVFNIVLYVIYIMCLYCTICILYFILINLYHHVYNYITTLYIIYHIFYNRIIGTVISNSLMWHMILYLCIHWSLYIIILYRYHNSIKYFIIILLYLYY